MDAASACSQRNQLLLQNCQLPCPQPPSNRSRVSTSVQNNAETSPKIPPRCTVSRRCAESRWGRPTSRRNLGSGQWHGRGVGGALFQWSALRLWFGMSLALVEFTHVYTLQQARQRERSDGAWLS